MPVQAVIYLCADDGSLFEGHVIEHEGKKWLVPEWL
jgi:hypothetical protein